MSLLEGASRVALALHYARCGTPLGVIIKRNLLHTLDGREVFKKKLQGRGGHRFDFFGAKTKRSGAVVSVLGS